MAKVISDMELSFKAFLFASFIYKTFILMNWRSSILSSLIVLIFTRWCPSWQPIDDKKYIIYLELAFDIFMLNAFSSSILYDYCHFANTLFHICYLSKMADKMVALTKKI